MSIEVLTRSAENTQARVEMRRRGLDCATPRLKRLLRKAHLIRGVNVGLQQKSWDVLRTLRFVEEHVNKTAPILDLGAHSSEILLSLCEMGFSDLTGIDLNPELARMPYRKSIKYVTGDLTQTPFPAEAFSAITAISVIEHGYVGPKVFREISRILKPGGYLIGSTDYWPEKISTRGISLYGLDWKIFSKAELLDLVEEARGHGLVPVGPLNFKPVEATVRWLNRKYTFAWFAFQKADAKRTGLVS